MFIHSFVLGVTRNRPLATTLLLVQTLCVIMTPIVFSLLWEHDNTKFQNSTAEQILCTQRCYCTPGKTLCRLLLRSRIQMEEHLVVGTALHTIVGQWSKPQKHLLLKTTQRHN